MEQAQVLRILLPERYAILCEGYNLISAAACNK